MQYQYKNKLFKVRTINELKHALCCENEDFGNHPVLTKEEMKSSNIKIISNNINLAHFLNSEFDIPTLNNFANRSARALCDSYPPTQYYNKNSIITFADYLISIFKSVMRYRTYEYLKNHPISGRYCNINDIKISTMTIIDKIINIYDFNEEYIILRYSKKAKWCDKITSNNIHNYFIQNEIIDFNNYKLSNEVIYELDLLEHTFIYNSIKEILPKNNLSWLLAYL